MSNTQSATQTFEQSDVEQNKVMGVLAYFNLLVLVPILAAKDSPFAKFHANQGLVLMIAEFIVSLLCMIPFVNFVAWLLYIPLGVFAIMGLINAINGVGKELPLIGKIKILK